MRTSWSRCYFSTAPGHTGGVLLEKMEQNRLLVDDQWRAVRVTFAVTRRVAGPRKSQAE